MFWTLWRSRKPTKMTPKSLKIISYYVHQMFPQKAGAGGPPRCQEYLLKKFKNLEFAAGHGSAATPVAHWCTSCKHHILELSSIGIPLGMSFCFEMVLGGFCMVLKCSEQFHLHVVSSAWLWKDRIWPLLPMLLRFGSLTWQWKIP